MDNLVVMLSNFTTLLDPNVGPETVVVFGQNEKAKQGLEAMFDIANRYDINLMDDRVSWTLGSVVCRECVFCLGHSFHLQKGVLYLDVVLSSYATMLPKQFSSECAVQDERPFCERFRLVKMRLNRGARTNQRLIKAFWAFLQIADLWMLNFMFQTLCWNFIFFLNVKMLIPGSDANRVPLLGACGFTAGKDSFVSAYQGRQSFVFPSAQVR